MSKIEPRSTFTPLDKVFAGQRADQQDVRPRRDVCLRQDEPLLVNYTFSFSVSNGARRAQRNGFSLCGEECGKNDGIARILYLII